MPYASTSKLPASVRNNLPKHAQAIYRKAFENAWDEYKAPEKRRGRASREEAAHKVAWSAVKTQYKKNGTGEWSARSDNSMTKSPRKAAGKAKSASSTNSATKKSARKSAVKVKAKSKPQAVKKAGAKSAAKSRQPRWKAASAQKTARKSRGKTAAGPTGTTRQRKSRKSPTSALERRNTRQESVNTSLQSGQGLMTPTPVQQQLDAGQVS